MTVSINGTNGLTFNDGSSQATAATGFGFRNRIINGAMVIDQRNNGASVTPANQDYTLDRWLAGLTQSSKFTVQRSTVAPDGFSNSLLVTSSSAYSVGSGDAFFIQQRIEGFNSYDLMYGTATAKTTTLSFWVRSSLTGTFGGNFANSGTTRSYPFSYTISAANTWELKSITVPGDTTGTWVGATNGQGLLVTFGLGVGTTLSGTAGAWAAGNFISATGAVSVVGTNGATLYITGVDLQKGSTATSFDYRPYGTELALCQRYYQQTQQAIPMFGYNTASGQVWGYVAFPVYMRAAPTASATYSSLSAASGKSVTASVQGVVMGIDATAGGVFSGSYASGNTFSSEL